MRVWPWHCMRWQWSWPWGFVTPPVLALLLLLFLGLSTPVNYKTQLFVSALVKGNLSFLQSRAAPFPILRLAFKSRSNLVRIQRHPLKARQLCDNTPPKLLILVASSPGEEELRKVIRETWASELPSQVSVVFVLARSNRSEWERSESEADEYGDILLLDFKEHYFNLTLKTYASLAWAGIFCPGAKAVLKTDSDVVVVAENLLRLSQSLSGAKIVGACWDGAVVVRERSQAKLYVSRAEYTEKMYPRYCSGTGYLLTAEAVRRILAATPGLAYLKMEDVMFTGLAASAAHVSRESLGGFGWKKGAPLAGSCTRRFTQHSSHGERDLRKRWSHHLQLCNSTEGLLTQLSILNQM